MIDYLDELQHVADSPRFLRHMAYDSDFGCMEVLLQELSQAKAEQKKNRAYAKMTAKKAGLQLWTLLLRPGERMALTKLAFKYAEIEKQIFNGLGERFDVSVKNSVEGEPPHWLLKGKPTRRLTLRDGVELVEQWQSQQWSMADALRVLNTPLPLPIKSHIRQLPVESRVAALDALAWCEHAVAQENELLITVEQFEQIIKLPEELRWVLLKAPDRLEDAVNNRGVRFECLPSSEKWFKLLGFYLPSAISKKFSTRNFKVATLLRILNMLGLKPSKSKSSGPLLTDKHGLLKPLFNLVSFFGDLNSIERFVQKKGLPFTAQGLHDAGQFVLPSNVLDLKPWVRLALAHPDVLTYSKSFAALEKRGIKPKSLQEAKRAVLELGYPQVESRFQGLVSICRDYGLDGEVLKRYLKFWKEVSVKTAEFCPRVCFNGSAVGAGKEWVFEKLSASAWEGPMLGLLTSCCQHLEGAASSCAEDGVVDPYSAFYVVRRNGRIVAQSWAWRSDDCLVFDSIESMHRDEESLDVIAKLYLRGAMEIVKDGRLGISGVLAGTGSYGANAKIVELLQAHLTRVNKTRNGQYHKMVPYSYSGYKDGHEQLLLAGHARSKAKLSSVPQPEGYKKKVGSPRFALEPLVVDEFWRMCAADVDYC